MAQRLPCASAVARMALPEEVREALDAIGRDAGPTISADEAAALEEQADRMLSRIDELPVFHRVRSPG